MKYKRVSAAVLAAVSIAMSCAAIRVTAVKDEAYVDAFAKNERPNEIICFDKSDFIVYADEENTLEAIAITELPSVGAVKLDMYEVKVGDIIDFDLMERMTFSAQGMDDVCEKMRFKPVFAKTGTSDSEVEVTLSISSKPNSTPVAVNADYKTYTNVKLCGTLKAVDADNDECSFQITSKPKKGSVSVEGSEFVYTPDNNKSGKDSFKFKAIDTRGNTSAEATITVEICKPASKDTFYYCDMNESEAHYAALYLREEGVMSGETFGEENFFYPDAEVTRAQFVALISSVSQFALPTVSVGTGLSDNEAIPAWARPYVAAAINCGVVSGENSDDGNKVFRANDPITRAEAAAIIDRAMELAEDGRAMTFSDASQVPQWAQQSIINTTAAGIVPVFNDNTVRASENVTREDAALMLYEAVCYVQEKTKETGILSRIFGK